MPSSSAGPATAGPSTTRIVGTTPEQSASALATRPQPSSEAIPSTMPAPVEARTMTSGIPSTRATVAAWARLADACDGQRRAFRCRRSARLRTPPRRRIARRRRRRGSGPRSSPNRRRRCATRGRRPSSSVDRSCPTGLIAVSGKASDPRRTPACSSALRRQGGTEYVEQAFTAPLGPGRRCEVRATTRAAAPARGPWRSGVRRGCGTAVAGTIAAPCPSTARVASRRTPSTSASALSWAPTERAARSSTRRRADPGGGRRQAVAGELGEMDRRALGERVAVAGEQQEVLGEQRLDGQLRLVDGEVDDRRVVLSGQQRRNQHRRAALGDDHADLGMARRHLGEQAGEQPPSGRAEHPEAHVADDVTVALGHLGGDLVELAQHPPGALDHPSAVVGEPAVGPVDELRAELLLQAGDVAGDVRLHGEERSSGRRERPVVGDRHEGGELADVHRGTLALHLQQRWSASICSSCQIGGLCVYSQIHSRSDTPPMYRSIGPNVDPPSTGFRLRDPASPSRVFPVLFR